MSMLIAWAVCGLALWVGLVLEDGCPRKAVLEEASKKDSRRRVDAFMSYGHTFNARKNSLVLALVFGPLTYLVA